MAEVDHRNRWDEGEIRHLVLDAEVCVPSEQARLQKRFSVWPDGEMTLDDHYTLVLHPLDEAFADETRDPYEGRAWELSWPDR